MQFSCIACPLRNILIREGITDFPQEFVLWLPSFHSLRGDNRSTLHLRKCCKKSSQSIQYNESIQTQFEIQLRIQGQSQNDTNCNIEMPAFFLPNSFKIALQVMNFYGHRYCMSKAIFKLTVIKVRRKSRSTYIVCIFRYSLKSCAKCWVYHGKKMIYR